MICVQQPVSVAARILPPASEYLLEELGDVGVAGAGASGLADPRRLDVGGNEGEIRILDEFAAPAPSNRASARCRPPTASQRRVDVHALLDHIVDEGRKELRIDRRLRVVPAGLGSFPSCSRSARAIVSVCSMCFMPMSTAFLMFCVWPSTFSPCAVAFFDHRAQLLVGDRQIDLDVIDPGGLQVRT